jgi:ferric-dicitrate binding protein FerR (iron transport regulator)
MTPHESLVLRIHDLASRVLAGEASATDRRELDELIVASPAARRVYLDYIDDTALLRRQAADHEPEIVRDLLADEPPRPTRRVAGGLALPLAAAAVAVGVAAWFATVGLPKKVRVATLIRTTAVQWSDNSPAWPELTRLGRGDVLRFDSGEVELVFDTGVEVIIRGPADFEVRSDDRAFSRLGRITARVGADGGGFTIETPVAEVIDLGTEFAVEVTPSGSTDVAVFRGLVDLAVREPATAGATARRLAQGEGMRVEPGGRVGRMMAISSDHFPDSTRSASRFAGGAPVIGDVRDNSPSNAVSKFYRIVRDGLDEDAAAFVDRNHQWNGVDSTGLPACLSGIDYVMTFNDDKFVDGFAMTVDVVRPAALYVFLSDQVPVPEWLRVSFRETGLKIGLDSARSRYKPRLTTGVGPGVSIDTTFSVWRRDVPEPGTVVLGGVAPAADREGFNMYGVAAAPLESADVPRTAPAAP